MSNKWQRWLTGEAEKSYNCRKFLPPPGAEVVAQWAEWLCIEREKLAKARGMLYSVKFESYTQEELDEILEETKG